MVETTARPREALRRRARRCWGGMVILLTLAYVLGLGVLAWQERRGAELRWWSTVNLYVPQMLWAIPAPLLYLAALLYRPRRRWLPLLPLLPGLLVVLGRMGYANVVPPVPVSVPAGHTPLRVMTYNVERASTTIPAVLRSLAQEQPQLFFAQDRSKEFEDALRRAYPRWNVVGYGQLLIASPLPLRFLGNVSLPTHEALWKSATCIRATVRVGTTDIVLYNVHLTSPRDALGLLIADRKAILARHPSAAWQELEANTTSRVLQAWTLGAQVGQEHGPVLVAGDFNAPMSSLVCRQLTQAGLRETFAVAGRGYGYTFGHSLRVGEPYVRIDHVYASWQFRVSACHIGSSRVSDHLPVIADLSVP